MHESNQLGHFGHFHAIGSDRSNTTADNQATEQQRKAIGQVSCRLGRADHLGDGSQRRDDCDRHPRHAEGVATTGGGRVRQPFERLNQTN